MEFKLYNLTGKDLKRAVNLKLLFWFTFFSLLFVPITNSFITNTKNLIKLLIANNHYEDTVNKLYSENTELNSKVKYYKSSEGLKNLVKERLGKVDEGELLIKLDAKE